jgi:hypothetical protein
MRELLKRLWRGVNGLSAVDFFESGVYFITELHGRTQEKPEKDVEEKRSDPVYKSQSTSDGSEIKS